MPLNVIADTSILVSAFLFPESVPGQVMVRAAQGVYALHFSPIIFEEARRSLRNPRLRTSYRYTDEKIENWCDDLHRVGNAILQPLPQIEPICRDPDDDHVLAAALVINADYLVTGDKDLLVLGQHQKTHIVTARAFLTEIE
ncbi:MAG: putative toxin-antitoxin system toxin component, PIN family [Candidatus Competibacteraceae bacterium]|nr:putative toxin-antitoxin system toxin component, PIN family [Candidatus Competibacteraceae bacterium]MCP5134789.1 putative toxin-antitoxin system toxin component, PIN family [Gammaproteobacteria bacterium]MCB1770026.1 putative toxin-antitoxin system toxin component, PIN family [Candidatus Competibacteraceae bacterium]MCB1780123.1 putative toxin-antitoxin system toxin component, PIN family [Candidatus Competibacteraceae bacterium]HPF58578.1 putative toxin-antitoxin system toxin component, PIN